MEILKFDNSELKPAERKSSRGMLIIGLVATLFGISSAFASSTITINNDTPITLGQGVSFVTGCDSNISVVPSTSMIIETSTPTFYLDKIIVSDVDTRTSSSATEGLGCAGKILDIQVFHGTGGSTSAYSCADLKHTTSFNISYVDGTPQTVSGSCADSKLSFVVPSGISALNPSFEVPFSKAPSDISYLTLVSRNA